MSEWISVKDRLPDDKQNVLAWCSILFGEPKIVFYIKGIFHHNQLASEDITKWVTHWMTLPEPPVNKE